MTRAVSLHARHRYPDAGSAGDHGHLYRIEVTVRGLIDGARQAVIDLATLDGILTEEIAKPVDGRHLNEAIADFASDGWLPTCEAFAAWCWRQIAPRLPSGVQLERVRVAEDATLWADCTGVG
ncbi:MAG TPA: 6-carboxytetrahydropterin synthase [Gemmatimonadales bacterium]